ncbi:Mitochondrial import inner membrane translocase subunit TIM22 [Babesia duncani]|uniref:Mitochondrial import inner membrane translocase subunit TIM22 n=1 Tax=Babesia duncani TaxID=323732 RepID=A0AAD9UNN8_9APIC|nr:Mitochondrial import inner membrane translocase subunit TIM22 [Babesia duncani]
MDDDYAKVFLSDRYRNLSLIKNQQSPQEIQMQQVLGLQQQVQENCILKAGVVGVGSAVFGVLFGTFLFTVTSSNTPYDTPISLKQEFKNQLHKFVPHVKSTSKNFAKLGFLYSMFECFIQKKRARSDVYNSLYAGCATGALLSFKGLFSGFCSDAGGPISAIGGCGGFAAFSAAVDLYQRHRS